MFWLAKEGASLPVCRLICRYLSSHKAFQEDAERVFDNHIKFCEAEPTFSLAQASKREAQRLRALLPGLVALLPAQTAEDRAQSADKLRTAMHELLKRAMKLDSKMQFHAPVTRATFANPAVAEECVHYCVHLRCIGCTLPLPPMIADRLLIHCLLGISQ